jgi:serine/threonine protein kinase
MSSSTPIDATLPMRAGRWPRLRLGERAGRYRLTAVLGAGAMGVVYRGFDPVLGRDVALKSLHVQDVHTRQRFVQEARAMARVSHENVVQVFDVVRSDRPEGEGPQWLIAMELVEGRTLDRWLQEPRSWQEIRDVFAAAGRGLAAAHAAGLVHRDFKPANVIVGRDGRVRVTDFGLSVSHEERASTLDDGGSSATMSFDGIRDVTVPGGLVVGTPAYMAPEQHRGAMLCPAADQFAFCAALFEALFDGRPFDGRSCRELAQQKHDGEIRRGRGGRAVPAWLRRAVLRGLRVDPERRFSSMLALLAALGDPGARPRPWHAVRTAVLLSLLGGGLGLVISGGPWASTEAQAGSSEGQSAAGSSFASAGTPSAGATG